LFTSKKEIEDLKKKVEQQEQLLKEMIYHVTHLANEINDLKKPKQPNYFG